MFRGRVHGVSGSCGVRVGRVFGRVGGASAGVRESGCTLLGKRNGVSVGETGGGAQTLKRSAPPFLVFARVFTRVLVVVYLCGSRMVVWVAAASPLTTRPSLCSMVRPWCAVRPL